MKRGTLTTIGKIAFAGGLLAWVIHQVGFDTIRDALSEMDRAQWAVGLAIMFSAHCLSMVRWHVLMHSVGLNSTPWVALRLGFIGVFFNNVVPGLTGGDLVKAIYVTRENPQQRAAAVVSVIVDRIIGIIALALIAAVVIPFDFETFGEAAIGIYGFLGAATIGGGVALSRRAKAAVRSVLARLGRSGSDGEKTSLLAKIDQAVSMYRDRLGTVLVALGMSVGVHLLIIVALQVFGGALADGGLAALADEPAVAERTARQAELERLKAVDIADYCSVVPIIMIISAVPIAPAGIGVGEAAFQHFFRAVSVAEGDAVALSLTYRITAMLLSLLGGVLLLFDRKRVMEATAVEAEESSSSSAPSAAPPTD